MGLLTAQNIFGDYFNKELERLDRKEKEEADRTYNYSTLAVRNHEHAIEQARLDRQDARADARAKEEFDAQQTLLQAQEKRAQAEYDRNETAYNKKLAEENAYKKLLLDPTTADTNARNAVLNNSSSASSLLKDAGSTLEGIGEELNKGTENFIGALPQSFKDSLATTDSNGKKVEPHSYDILTKLTALKPEEVDKLGIDRRLVSRAHTLKGTTDQLYGNLTKLSDVGDNERSPYAKFLEEQAIGSASRGERESYHLKEALAAGLGLEEAKTYAKEKVAEVMTEAEKDKQKLEGLKSFSTIIENLSAKGVPVRDSTDAIVGYGSSSRIPKPSDKTNEHNENIAKSIDPSIFTSGNAKEHMSGWNNFIGEQKSSGISPGAYQAGIAAASLLATTAREKSKNLSFGDLQREFTTAANNYKPTATPHVDISDTQESKDELSQLLVEKAKSLVNSGVDPRDSVAALLQTGNMKNWLSQNAALEELSKQQPTQAPKPAEVLVKPNEMTAEDRVTRALTGVATNTANKDQGVEDLYKQLDIQQPELGLNAYMQAKAEGKTPSSEALKMALEEASVIAERNGTPKDVVGMLASTGNIEGLLNSAANLGYPSKWSMVRNSDKYKEADRAMRMANAEYNDGIPWYPTSALKSLIDPYATADMLYEGKKVRLPQLLAAKENASALVDRYNKADIGSVLLNLGVLPPLTR
jgi:hypothetical protein